MKKTLIIVLIQTMVLTAYAQLDSVQMQIDSIENALHYQKGRIWLGDSLAVIEVPDGFKYLDAEQSEFVLTDLWGNPKDPDITLGMILPEDMGGSGSRLLGI